MLQQAPYPWLMVLVPGGTIRDVSIRTAEILGYDIDSILELQIHDLFPGLQTNTCRGRCEAVCNDGHRLSFDYQCSVDENTGYSSIILHPAVANTPEKGKHDRPESLEHRFESIMNSSNDLIWCVSPNMELLAANNKFIDLLKKETGRSFLPGDSLKDAHPYITHFTESWKTDFEQIVSGGSVYEQKFIPASKSTKASWIEIKGTPLYENGVLAGVTCYASDITAAKDAEAKLIKSENNLAEAQRFSKMGNWHRDLRTEQLTWSKELYNIAGLPHNAPIYDRDVLMQYIDPAYHPLVLKNARQIRETGESYTQLYACTTPTGVQKMIEEKGYAVRDEHGKPVALIGTIQDVTEATQAQEQINKMLLEKETLLESIGDGFFAIDENWNVTYWNNRAGQLLGVSRDQVIGKNLWDVFATETNKTSYQKYNEARDRKEALHFEDYYGQLNMWYEINVYPSGRGLSVFFKDITPRKKAEEEIRVINERYDLMTRATHDSIWDMDITSGYITRTGDGYSQMFGYPFTAGTELDFLTGNLMHPDDRKRIMVSLQNCFDDPEKSYWEEEYRFLKADGEYAVVNDRGFIIRDQEKKATRMIGATRDITAVRRDMMELERVKQNLDTLINTTSDVIWSVDLDLKLVIANREFQRFTRVVLGRELKEGESVINGSTESQKAFWHDIYHTAITNGKLSTEVRITSSPDEDPQYLLITLSPMLNDDMVTGVVCFGKDITDINRSARLLEKSERRFNDLFHLSPQPMWLYEADTFLFSEANDAMLNTYGYSREELCNMTILDIRPKAEREKTREMILQGRREQRNVYQNSFRHLKKNGELMEVQIYSKPITINDKNYIMVIAIDITEKIAYEKRMTRAIIEAQEKERYEIGGELHDNVCQLLASSQMHLSLVKKALPASHLPMLEQSRQYLSMALDEIRNLSHRMAPSFFSDRTTEEAVTKLLHNFNADNKYQLEIHFDERMRSQPVNKEIQLNTYRILQEQLRNILKHADATKIGVGVNCCNDTLTMKVTDNGKGFDPSVASNGIGLSNMRRRAELLHGKLDIETAPGRGCTVTVAIPLSA